MYNTLGAVKSYHKLWKWAKQPHSEEKWRGYNMHSAGYRETNKQSIMTALWDLATQKYYITMHLNSIMQGNKKSDAAWSKYSFHTSMWCPGHMKTTQNFWYYGQVNGWVTGKTLRSAFNYIAHETFITHSATDRTAEIHLTYILMSTSSVFTPEPVSCYTQWKSYQYNQSTFKK